MSDLSLDTTVESAFGVVADELTRMLSMQLLVRCHQC